MHIKTIKGRKYYYKSIRKGKKVTSEYIGPVAEIDEEPHGKQKSDEQEKQEEQEDDYIG